MARQGSIFLTTGSVLRTQPGRPLLTVIADDVRRHDTIGGACSKESNTLRYGHHTRHQHACVENFLAEGARWGLGKRDLVRNINWYMNVPVEADGALGIVDGISAPGLSVTLRAARGRPRPHLQLPPGQQPVQRVRPHADPDRGHRAVSAGHALRHRAGGQPRRDRLSDHAVGHRAGAGARWPSSATPTAGHRMWPWPTPPSGSAPPRPGTATCGPTP